MKLKCTVLLSSLLLSLTTMAAAMKYQPGTYKVDADHSRIGFSIKHLVISDVEGRFEKVNGTFTLAPKFENSEAMVMVDTASINTGVTKRDEDLRGKDFFDVATYPSMTFKSKKFKGTPDNFTVIADLTIKDVTKEVPFKGKITGFVKDPWGNERGAAMLTGKIKRKDFHIMYDNKLPVGPVVGEEVTINVQTEGIKEVTTPAKEDKTP